MQTKLCKENLKERINQEDLDIGGRIIIKHTLFVHLLIYLEKNSFYGI
jgi:hypothetical protein